jgi:hypothetical protein
LVIEYPFRKFRPGVSLILRGQKFNVIRRDFHLRPGASVIRLICADGYHADNRDFPPFGKEFPAVFAQLTPCRDPEEIRFRLAFPGVPTVDSNSKCANADSL